MFPVTNAFCRLFISFFVRHYQDAPVDIEVDTSIFLSFLALTVVF